MFIIDENNNISITKGDTATLQIELYKDDEPYTMQSGEHLHFAVKAALDYNYTLFSKYVDTPKINFSPADTFSLSCCEFDYSITLEKANGDRDTFLTGKFTIMGVCEDGESENG